MGKTKISAGTHRGRLIVFPNEVSVRPTAQRMRMTLFNWLGQNLHGWHCLDLFAGSGSLGFEAVSRGATVDMVDHSRTVCRALNDNRSLFVWQDQVQIWCEDAFSFWKKVNKDQYDLIFLDPPFKQKVFSELSQTILKESGYDTYISWECSIHNIATAIPPGCVCLRETQCGDAHLALFHKQDIHD